MGDLDSTQRAAPGSFQGAARPQHPRTLFLHAGTHKTGSTSIQHLLYDRRDAILDLGCKVVVDFPAGQSDRANCAAIAHAFIRPALWTPTRICGHKPARFGARDVIDWLGSEITSVDCSSYILSAEAFCYLRTSVERDLLVSTLQTVGCTVVPVLYFRNRADWAASWADQIEKEPRVRAFRERYPDEFRLLDDWYFDHVAIYGFWRSVDPHAIFLDYDRIVSHRGSVIPSFLNTVGLPVSLDSGRYFMNRRRVRLARR